MGITVGQLAGEIGRFATRRAPAESGQSASQKPSDS